MNQDQRRAALEAFEGATGYDANDPTCVEEVDLWLRSWEIATEAAYERAAKDCMFESDMSDDGCSVQRVTRILAIRFAAIANGDQP